MTHTPPETAERLRARERPEGTPVMRQSWLKLLFMHWRMPAGELRRLIPERLTIDTFEGEAWVGLTPFTIRDALPTFVPPLPWVGDFHEVNVRTYVRLDGFPGVWFFSLDANSLAAVAGARAVFSLPYYRADITLGEEGETIVYSAAREGAEPPAVFEATYGAGEPLPRAEPGSLDFFLVERYCLYTSDGEKLYRCRIAHQPWPLRRASLSGFRSTLIEADGLPSPHGDPLLHFGGPVNVEVWPLEEV
ncbi:MAG TPA: DUF2071 domain-containing protein [Pyrinomonadaceae bacterium]|nr:DUF2071 domain-containing protein [Pyrinomonadaceae bacterium]